MNDERHTVTYYGPPALAQLLGQHLEDAGCRVKVQPMQERRDLPGALEAYGIAIAVWGTQAAIRAAVQRFRQRRPQANIDLDGEDTKGYL